MNDRLNLSIQGGKYTVIQREDGSTDALRYGEEWPAFSGSGPDNLHMALAYEVAALRASLERLSTFETFTSEGWGYSHPELTARVNFARAALVDAEGRV